MASKPITAFFSPPKSKRTPAENESEESPIAKKANTDNNNGGGGSLTPEQKMLIEDKKLKASMLASRTKGVPLFGTIAPSWQKILAGEEKKPYWPKLQAFLLAQKNASKTMYPPPDEVFSWSHASQFSEIKVVIIGQDPYHGPDQAHGLCFSVKKGVQIPPSLRNMYTELSSDIPGFKSPPHGNLQSWADQGVLLLNAVLTVNKGEPNSHKGQGWEKFTDAVIEAVNKHRNNVVFVLWGNYAKKKGAKVDTKRHCVLSSGHPSPLSVRTFYGCKHFSKANDYLRSKDCAPINWSSIME